MLSPIKPSKNAPAAAHEQFRSDVADKKQTPANWGFTGQRRLRAMVPVGELPAAAAPAPAKDAGRGKN